MKKKVSTVDKKLKTKEIVPTSKTSSYDYKTFETDMKAATVIGKYPNPSKKKKKR